MEILAAVFWFYNHLSSAASAVQTGPHDGHCFAKAPCEKRLRKRHEMGVIILQRKTQATQSYILLRININRH